VVFAKTPQTFLILLRSEVNVSLGKGAARKGEKRSPSQHKKKSEEGKILIPGETSSKRLNRGRSFELDLGRDEKRKISIG